MDMPRIDLQYLWQKLTPADMAIVRRVTKENTWRLRTSRPVLRDSDESRYAAFVWRMSAFLVSPNAQHHCMPMTCFFWLPEGTTKSTMQRLNRLVNEITDTVPPCFWWGVRAWSGLTSEGAEMRKSCLKGFKNDVSEYLKDSANRKARLQNAKDKGQNEAEWPDNSDRRTSEVKCPF